MRVHRMYPVAAAKAEGKYGRQGYHPLHQGNYTSGFLLSSASGHTQSTGGLGGPERGLFH
jgi:hypothetical protein